MEINCSKCKSNYSLTNDQFHELNHSFIHCKTCSRYIKIANCPHCKAFYSVTFGNLNQPDYKLICRKCRNEFKIFIPINKKTLNSNNNKKQKSYSNTTKFEQNYTQHPVQSSTKKSFQNSFHKENKDNKEKMVLKSPSINNFSLKELFAICSSAFTKNKIIIAVLGVISISLMLLFSKKIEYSLLNTFQLSGYKYISTFISLFNIALFFFVFTLSSAIISRVTLEELFYKKKWTPFKSIRFIEKTAITLFFSNIVFLAIINSMIILFGYIPVVGPVIFSLLFLPVYLISFIIILIAIVGFWFYPPIISLRMSGVKENFKGLYHFIRKHNFSLVYTVLILMMVTVMTFSIIYLLHHGAFSIAILLSKNLLNENIVAMFSAIPVNLRRIIDLSFFGTDLNIFKSLIDNLLLSYHLGGIIIGVILAIISLLLFGTFISITATVSTHVYIMMERGIDISDKNKIKLLVLLVLILTSTLLFKKIFT